MVPRSRRSIIAMIAAALSLAPKGAGAGGGLRLDYEASCRRLQQLGLIDPGPIPPKPDRMPRYDDDEPLGVSFFRTIVGDGADLSNLTLPRTFFGRSEISNVHFRNSELTESSLCWNDFIDVDFTDAVLVCSDLRASIYIRVNFTRADLSDCDLRLSNFDDCRFMDARMAGAVLTRQQGRSLPLSSKQRASISWAGEDGPEPGGG